MANEKVTLDTRQAVKSIEDLTYKIRIYNKSVQELTSRTKEQNQTSETINRRLKVLKDNLASVNSVISRTTNLGASQAAAFRNLNSSIGATARTFQKITTNASGIKQALNQVAASTNKFVTSSSASIRNITKLNQAVVGSVTELRTLNTELRLKIQDFGRFATSISVASNRLRNYQDATDRASRKTFEFGANLQTAYRVLFATAIHRIFLRLTQAIQESQQAAQELSLRIGEIRSISLRSSLATEEWTSQLLNLSNAFGLNILDAAEGAYQALSNQVVKSKDAQAFLTEEAKLATVGVTTLTNAVEATTSVLNAWNLSSERAGDVNAILFKSVEVGRFRLDEIANTLGKVSILSSQLGVSFLEQQAALSLLTRQGVTAERAITLVENVERALLKPSKELKKIFSEFGVTSGEAAIKAFGLVGTLEKLKAIADETGDSSQEMALIFKDIRSIIGAAGLTSQSFREELEKYGTSSQDAIDALKEITDTVGFKLKKAFAEAGNFFTVEVGTRINNTLIQFLEITGGATNALEKLFSLLLHGATIYASYRIAVTLLNVEKRRLVTLTGLEAAAVLLLNGRYQSAAIAIQQFLGSKFAATATLTLFIELLAKVAIDLHQFNANVEIAGKKLASELGAKGVESLEKLNAKADDTFRKLEADFTSVTQKYNQRIAAVRAENNKLEENFKKVFQQIGKEINKGLKEPLQDIDKEINKLKTESDKILTEIEASKKDIKERRFESDEKAFRHDISTLPELEQLKKLEDARIKLHRQALDAIADDDKEQADFLFKQQERIAEEITQRVKKLHEDATKDVPEKVESARREFDPLTRKFRIRREKVTVGEHDKDADEAIRLQKILNELEAQRRQEVELRIKAEEAFNTRQGDRAKKLAAEAKEREATVQSFRELLGLVDTFDVTQENALAKFQSLLDGLEDLSLDIGLSPEARINLLRKASEQEVLLKRQASQQILKDKLNKIQQETDAENRATRSQIKEKIAAQKNLNDKLSGLGGKIGDQLGALKDFFTNDLFETVGVRDFKGREELVDNLDSTIKALDKLSKESTPENFEKFKKSLNLVIDALDLLQSEGPQQAPFGALLDGLLDVSNLTGDFDVAGQTITERLTEIADAIDDVNKAQDRFDFAEGFGDLDGLKQRLEGITSELQKIRALQNNIPAATPAQGQFTGGGGLFAHGGRVAAGTDRIPAFLSPGEIVANAAASRYISPMIQMLNKLPPSIRDNQGGDVSFGDIHIHTPEGTSELQAEQIVRVLKRYTRKGFRG